MLDLFGKKSSGLVGLDISAFSLKMLELSRGSGGRYRVESFSFETLEPEIIEEKVIKKRELLAEALQRMIRNAKTPTRNVAIALSDSLVISKIIQVEAGLRDDQIGERINIDAEKYIPYPLEEVHLDYTVLGPHHDSNELEDVLLVACRSETITSLVDTISLAGLTAKVVEVESYATERACLILETLLPAIKNNEDQIIAIFDMGATVTNLIVLSGRETIYSRDELFGGEILIKDIVNKYKISREEAYKKLLADTLPEDFQAEILEPYKEAMVLQVRRALQFFFSASNFSEIHHILLAGGNANIPGIQTIIEEQLGVPTSVANPFKNMKVSPRVDSNALNHFAPALLLCTGLSLRAFD